MVSWNEGSDTNKDLEELVAEKWLLTRFLVVVRAHRRLWEALNESLLVDQGVTQDATLSNKTSKVFNSNPWVSVWLARVVQEDGVDVVVMGMKNFLHILKVSSEWPLDLAEIDVFVEALEQVLPRILLEFSF